MNPPPAKIADLTSPDRGVVILLTMIEGEEPHQVQLSRDQVFKLNAQTADLLLKVFK